MLVTAALLAGSEQLLKRRTQTKLLGQMSWTGCDPGRTGPGLGAGPWHQPEWQYDCGWACAWRAPRSGGPLQLLAGDTRHSGRRPLAAGPRCSGGCHTAVRRRPAADCRVHCGGGDGRVDDPISATLSAEPHALHFQRLLSRGWPAPSLSRLSGESALPGPACGRAGAGDRRLRGRRRRHATAGDDHHRRLVGHGACAARLRPRYAPASQHSLYHPRWRQHAGRGGDPRPALRHRRQHTLPTQPGSGSSLAAGQQQLVRTPIGLNGIAVIVHPSNNVDECAWCNCVISTRGACSTGSRLAAGCGRGGAGRRSGHGRACSSRTASWVTNGCRSRPSSCRRARMWWTLSQPRLRWPMSTHSRVSIGYRARRLMAMQRAMRRCRAGQGGPRRGQYRRATPSPARSTR